MGKCPNCGSYAVNDDPTKTLCDRCWRDARIALLDKCCRDAQIAKLEDRLAVLHFQKDNKKGGE